jgi:hypothetical protein
MFLDIDQASKSEDLQENQFLRNNYCHLCPFEIACSRLCREISNIARQFK